MITINNTDELLEFIKRDDITTKQATEIVCTVLNVIVVFEKTKAELIEATEYYIVTFMNNGISEKPIFLDQKGLDFKISDLAKPN
jgi:hypothetical protein